MLIDIHNLQYLGVPPYWVIFERERKEAAEEASKFNFDRNVPRICHALRANAIPSWGAAKKLSDKELLALPGIGAVLLNCFRLVSAPLAHYHFSYEMLGRRLMSKCK